MIPDYRRPVNECKEHFDEVGFYFIRCFHSDTRWIAMWKSPQHVLDNIPEREILIMNSWNLSVMWCLDKDKDTVWDSEVERMKLDMEVLA